MNDEVRMKAVIKKVIYSDISHIPTITHPYGINLIFDQCSPYRPKEGLKFFLKYIRDTFTDYELSGYRADGHSLHFATKSPSTLSMFLLRWGGYCEVEPYNLKSPDGIIR